MSALRGRRALITGGTGFIGRALAIGLDDAGAELVAAARDAEAARRLFDAVEIEPEIVPWDALEADSARRLVEEAAPELVFNLAGYGVDPRERDPRAMNVLNAELPSRMAEALAGLRAASRSGDAWPGTTFIHTGSALEYGVATGDLSEDSLPEPTTPYGQTKLAGTLALGRAARRLEVASVTARLFTVYGPGERPGRLLPCVLDAWRSGERLSLTAGDQQRDFTYVEDVVEGLLRLAVIRSLPGDVVNLATGRLLTVREFVEQAAAELEMPDSQLGFGDRPTRPAEMDHEPVNVQRMLERTGWVPDTGVADGVRATVRFEQRYPAPPTT